MSSFKLRLLINLIGCGLVIFCFTCFAFLPALILSCIVAYDTTLIISILPEGDDGA